MEGSVDYCEEEMLAYSPQFQLRHGASKCTLESKQKIQGSLRAPSSNQTLLMYSFSQSDSPGVLVGDDGCIIISKLSI
jgi:hypothetical protein